MKTINIKWLFVFLLGLSFSTNQLDAQELRLTSATFALGEIPRSYNGVSLGLETSLSTHFTLGVDGSYAYNSLKGGLWAIQPTVRFYFNDDHTGFYLGANTKLMKLNELDDRNEYPSHLYALGFDLGFKSRITESLMLIVQASPHLTVGGPGVSDVAGISGNIGLSYRF